MYRLKLSSAALMGILLATTLPAQAESLNPSLDDVFQARIGAFFANFDTRVDVSGSSFDQDGPLDDSKTTAMLFARWRITPKLHVDLGYSKISREDTTTLASAIPVGGLSVLGGTVLSQEYETSSLPIMLGYAFVKNERTEFGIEGGVTLTKLKNSIRITAPGAPTVTPLSYEVSEPLPTIGLFWNQALSPQWMFNAGAGYAPVSVGDIDAKFYRAYANVEWRPWKNIGIGAAYSYFRADGDVTSLGTKIGFEYQYDGPFVYMMFGVGSR